MYKQYPFVKLGNIISVYAILEIRCKYHISSYICRSHRIIWSKTFNELSYNSTNSWNNYKSIDQKQWRIHVNSHIQILLAVNIYNSENIKLVD